MPNSGRGVAKAWSWLAATALLTMHCSTQSGGPAADSSKNSGSLNSFSVSCVQEGETEVAGRTIPMTQCVEHYGGSPRDARILCDAAQEIGEDLNPDFTSEWQAGPCPRDDVRVACELKSEGMRTIQYHYKSSSQISSCPGNAKQVSNPDVPGQADAQKAKSGPSREEIFAPSEEEKQRGRPFEQRWEGKEIWTGSLCVQFSTKPGQCVVTDHNSEQDRYIRKRGTCGVTYDISSFLENDDGVPEHTLEITCDPEQGKSCEQPTVIGGTEFPNVLPKTVAILNRYGEISANENPVKDRLSVLSWKIGDKVCEYGD